MSRIFGGGNRAWWVYAVLGILATAVYFLLPGPAQNPFYDALAFSAATAMVLGVRRNRPTHSLGWYLLAAGLLSFLGGDVIWSFYEDVLRLEVPFPSVADTLYLLGYPLMAAGLVLMIRARTPWKDTASLIDATIIATGLGVLSWVFLMDPYANDLSLSLLERTVSIAYPLMDVLLLAVVVRLVVGSGARLPAYYLLVLGLSAMLVADVVYAAAALAGTYQSGDLVDAGWLLGYVFFGATALHPSMRTLTEPVRRGEVQVSWRRLAVLAGASLPAPVALLIQDVSGQDIDVPIIFAGSVVLFSLVSVRMAGLLADLQRYRSEARFRSLIQNASDVILVFDADGTVRYSSPSIRSVMGYTVEDFVDKTNFAWVHPDDVLAIRRYLTDRLKAPGAGPAIEFRYRHADGSSRHLEAIASNLLDDPNVGGISLTARDTTERKALEEQLMHRAFHDPLTSLPNRALFVDRLQHALDRSARYLISTAVLFLDLDGFKVVNDSLGHKEGDRLLLSVSRRLESCLRPGDTVARLGGDEFTVLLEDIASEDEAIAAAERLMEGLKEPIKLDEREVFVTVSIGIVLSTSGHGNPDDLLRNADAAMYEAKARGKGRYEVFDPGMNTRLLERLQVESEMNQAIRDGEFRVYYQPSMFLENGTMTGFEALLRWEHPTRGTLSPETFLDIAEDSGLIVPIGSWVLREACRQTLEWQQRQPAEPPLTISVNVSAKQLQQATFPQDVAECLRETGLDPGSLCLEITESVAMDDKPSTLSTLQRLKDLGVKLAIDDFGTGYSFFSYVQAFPVDVLKIDRSFVENLGHDRRSASIVSTVISFARSLGLHITAEGIENPEQLAQLLETGCPLGQGFYFGRPLPSEEAEQLVFSTHLKQGKGRS